MSEAWCPTSSTRRRVRAGEVNSPAIGSGFCERSVCKNEGLRRGVLIERDERERIDKYGERG